MSNQQGVLYTEHSDLVAILPRERRETAMRLRASSGLRSGLWPVRAISRMGHPAFFRTGCYRNLNVIVNGCCSSTTA